MVMHLLRRFNPRASRRYRALLRVRSPRRMNCSRTHRPYGRRSVIGDRSRASGCGCRGALRRCSRRVVRRPAWPSLDLVRPILARRARGMSAARIDLSGFAGVRAPSRGVPSCRLSAAAYAASMRLRITRSCGDRRGRVAIAGTALFGSREPGQCEPGGSTVRTPRHVLDGGVCGRPLWGHACASACTVCRH
jgi:hypothetical protein